MDEPRTGRVVLWAVPILLVLLVAIASLAAMAMIGIDFATGGPVDAPEVATPETIPSPDPVRLTIGVSCAVVLTVLAIRLARPRSGESMSGQ
jgi:hypothetical protein